MSRSCSCGLRYEIDDDLEYRCFTCQPRPPAGWLWRSIEAAKKAREMNAPAIRAQRAKDIEDAVIVMAMTAFAESVKGQDLVLDDASITAFRREYALPIALGMLRAAARFVWVTAPTGATHGGLLHTLEENIAICAHEVVSGDLPAGEYWVTVAAAQSIPPE